MRDVPITYDGVELTVMVPDNLNDQEIEELIGSHREALAVEASKVKIQVNPQAEQKRVARELTQTQRFLVGAGREITSQLRGLAQAGTEALSEAVGSIPEGPGHLLSIENREKHQANLDEFAKGFARDDLRDEQVFNILDDLTDSKKWMGSFGAEDLGQVVADAAMLAVGGPTRFGLTIAGGLLGGTEVTPENASRLMNTVSGAVTGFLAGFGGQVVGSLTPLRTGQTLTGELAKIGIKGIKANAIATIMGAAKVMPGVRLMGLDKILSAILTGTTRKEITRAAKQITEAKAQDARQEAIMRFISPLLGGLGFESELAAAELDRVRREFQESQQQ